MFSVRVTTEFFALRAQELIDKYQDWAKRVVSLVTSRVAGARDRAGRVDKRSDIREDLPKSKT
jgi:hypothetical protein